MEPEKGKEEANVVQLDVPLEGSGSEDGEDCATEEVEDETTVYADFEVGWRKFQDWIRANAAVLGEEKGTLLQKAICSKNAPLALITLTSLFGWKVAPTGEVNHVRAAIEMGDLESLLGIVGTQIDVSNVKLPIDLVEKGFQFGNFFIDVVDELNQ